MVKMSLIATYAIYNINNNNKRKLMNFSNDESILKIKPSVRKHYKNSKKDS